MARRCCSCLSVLKLLVLVLVLVQAAAAAGRRPTCRCQPSEACWPTPSTWQAFNQSVNGRLISTRPPGAPCHSPSYDPAGCSNVVQNAADPFWRADQPGALQSPANEQLVPSQSCLPQPNSTSPCYQGAVPLYAVNASKPVHVQKTVAFASQHNIRLVIKNSGHDVTGRNTAPNSLSIWVHGLRSIEFVPNSNDLVKVQAGVLWEELFKAADVHNRTMAGSECTSVGAAGGYVQGGGHSPLSPSFGLAADNIVEYELVTADGRLVVANSCNNRALFWALRGGGGGTFGVVTSATYSTHPALSSLVFASYTISSSSRSTFQTFLSYFLVANPRLSDERWGGVFVIGNNSLTIELLLPNRGRAFAELTFQPLLSYAYALNMTVTGTMTSFPSYYAWHLAKQCPNGKCGFPSGFSVIEASRLIPRTTLADSSQQLAGALLSMYDDLGQYLVRFAGYLVAGGRVASPVRPDSAVNPAWRKAVLHVLVVQALPDNLSDVGKQALRTRLTAAVQKLRDLTPGSGTYLNEGDINEPDWQRAFFGGNYGRLKAIKRAVDPTGLFLCSHCVGSEDKACVSV